jgi:hypothetical protein
MLRTFSRDEIVRKFRALGFDGPVSGGKHQFMVHGALKVRIHHEPLTTRYIPPAKGVMIKEYDLVGKMLNGLIHSLDRRPNDDQTPTTKN